jgi:hypothetical protein
MGEAKEVETARALSGLRLRTGKRRTPEGHQPRLLNIDLKSEPGTALGQYPLNLQGVLLTLEAHDEVIGITNHEVPPSACGLDGFYEPFVQHLMEIYIADQW